MVDAEIAAFDGFWQCQFLGAGSRAPKPVTLARRAPNMWILLSSRHTSPWFLIGRKTIKRFTSMRPPVAATAPRPAALSPLQLKQGGIDESARARAECPLEPIPPSPGLAVGRVWFRQIRVDTPQLDSHGRAARDTGSRSNRNIAFRCHGAFSGLPKERTSDRSHRRSSIASADQVPSVKFPLRAPRGAPGFKPPCKRHRLRPRMAGHLHGGPARVLASHLGARLRFPSRVLTSWSMGLFASFFAPRIPGCGN